MNLPVNTLLQGGKYKIVRFINSGGFGCTYEAVHVMLDRRVAIKEFFVKDYCNRDETTARVTVGTESKKELVSRLRDKFIEEAKALCRLDHPGIVRVFDVFEENGTAYYVMRYIDGLSLGDLVKREGPLSEQRALKYIRQLAEALDYVHRNNRLHLDIKPSNIMVGPSDRAILIDFGASKYYGADHGENTSTLMGKTPGYAPLEQMGNDVGQFMPASDIYALGATFYKLLSGLTPPDAYQLVSGARLQPLPDEISASTRTAIAEAMRINKFERPQSIQEFLDLLNGTSLSQKPTPSVAEEQKTAAGASNEVSLNGGAAPAEIRGEHQSKAEKNTALRRKNASPKKSFNPYDRSSSFQSAPSPQSPSASPSRPQKPNVHPAPVAASSTVEVEEEWEEESGRSKEKKIIIVLLFLLLAVGAFFYFKPTLDRWRKPSTPTVEAMRYVNANGLMFIYTGEVTPDSIPEGKGVGIYEYGTYRGNYQQGIRKGEGVYTTFYGGNRFEGSFVNDSYQYGRLYFQDSTYYEGLFVNNSYHNGIMYTKKDEISYVVQ